MEDLNKVYAQRIAEEYAPKKETKVVQLKKLDEKVKRPAEITGIVLGIIGALILGAGMSCVLTDFGPSGQAGLIAGIIVGVVGLIIAGVAYPIYNKILVTRKQKYAYEITELAKEITEENN